MSDQPQDAATIAELGKLATTHKETFCFEYIVNSGERIHRVTISVEDNGEPYTELSDRAFERAMEVAQHRFRHMEDPDIEMWSE